MRKGMGRWVPSAAVYKCEGVLCTVGRGRGEGGGRWLAAN